jgi:hypothetical protein
VQAGAAALKTGRHGFGVDFGCDPQYAGWIAVLGRNRYNPLAKPTKLVANISAMAALRLLY